jgi:hypothetical protein
MKKYHITFILSLLTTCYTFSQEWIWSNQLESPGNLYPSPNIVSAIITDDNNNVYHCGGFDGSTMTIQDAILSNSVGSTWDGFVSKFDENGKLLWLRQIHSDGNDDAVAMAIVGNYLFVIGPYSDLVTFAPGKTLTHSGGSFDSYLAKYDLDGNFIKATQIFWSANIARAKDMTYDSRRKELVITGFLKTEINYFDGSVNQNIPSKEGGKDIFIVQADTSGTVKNINTFWTLALNNKSVIKDVNISADSNYYLSGDLVDKLIFAPGDTIYGDLLSDALLIKVDKNLNKTWTRIASSSGYDHANSGASDKDGNIYLTGKVSTDITFYNSSGYSPVVLPATSGIDLFVAKYYPDGRIAWAKRKGGKGNDDGFGIAINENLVQLIGNYADTIIFNDDTLTSSSTVDINTSFAVLDLDGNEIGAQGIGGTGEDIGRSLAINKNGRTIISGYFTSPTLSIKDSTYTNTLPTTARDGFIASFSYPFKGVITKENDITCPNGNNGKLLVTSYFGIGPYTYAWSSPDTNTIESNDSVAFNLAAGTYSVTITDSRGQHTTSPAFVLADPEDFNITLLPSDLSCYESEDGAINTTVTGGTPSYNYAWEGPSGNDPVAKDQVDLLAGKYTITVTDSKGCKAKDSVDVLQPDKIIFGNVVVAPSDPAGTGSIDLDVSGGAGNYTYAWVFNTTDSLIGRTYDTLKNLIDGDYKAYAIDQDLCQQDTTISVPGAEMRVDLVGTNVTCYNDGNGSAYATIISGRKSYPFIFTFRDEFNNPISPVNDSIIESLLPGKYFVTATEQGGDNRIAMDTVIIAQPDTLTLSFDADSVDCNGKETGVITLTVSGGNGSNTYLWSNGSVSKNLTNIPAGKYNVRVTDSKSCTSIDSTIVEEPTALNVNVVLNHIISCKGYNDGRLLANVSGGITPYTYSWDDPVNQVNQVAVNLYSGNYAVTVTDMNGCINSDSYNLTEPLPLSLATVDTNHITCKNANDGSISVEMAGGTAPYSYSWNQTGLGNTNTIQGLFPVLYALTVTDANGCVNDSLSFKVQSPPSQLKLEEIIENHVDNKCFDGTSGRLTVRADGGWEDYQFSSDLQNWKNDSNFVDLASSAYTISVKDKNGCIANLGIEVLQPTELSIIVNASENVIEAEGNGGTLPYLFSLNGGAWQELGTFNSLRTGSYSVELVDANGCSISSENVVLTDINTTKADEYPGIYPNPSKGMFNLFFNSSSGTELNIEILSLLGSSIYNDTEYISAGENQVVPIDISDQEPGVYLLRINGTVSDTKLIIK